MAIELPPALQFLDFILLDEPNHWQPLAFESAFTQNGLETDKVQTFIGSAWGDVRPFALHREPGQQVYFDPGQPPLLGGAGDAAFKENSVDVIRYSRRLDPDEAPIIDISPGSIGNNTLGLNDGTGYSLNPITSLPYAANTVNEADFGRVVAEFWATDPARKRLRDTGIRSPTRSWNPISSSVAWRARGRSSMPLNGT